MKSSTLIFIICICGAGYTFLHKYKKDLVTNSAVSQFTSAADQNGFIPIPVSPVNMPQGKVMIIAPPNCPSPEGRRADALEHLLAERGIPYYRTGSVRFPLVEASGAPIIATIMNGALPIVFIQDKAQNNPDISKITAEFQSGHPKSKVY